MLQEFYVTVTRKLARPLNPTAATEAVTRFAELPLVQIDGKLILSAIHRSRDSRLSFWDALVVQAAIEGHANTLYSEHMQDGQTVRLEISAQGLLIRPAHNTRLTSL